MNKKAKAAPPSSFARLRVLSAVLPLLVLAIALAVSYAVWERERREIERVLKEDFDQRVNDAVNVFRERVQGYEQVLRAVSGLFASSRKVERIDFQTFVRNLKMEIHPGLQGVGYSVLVPGEQIERHLAAVRAEGFPSYAIRPAGERPFYTSAIFFAPPSAAELSTIGSDYFAEPSRRAALEQARDTAGVAVSNKIRLPGEDAREIQPGFRMVWPVYRNGAPLATVQERRENIVGWIFAAFSMEGLLGSTLGGERGSLALEVFDGSELQGEAAAGTSESVVVDRVGGESSLRLFTAAKRVEAGGHTWMVTAQALPNFATPIAISQLQLVTIVGGASSVTLALFTWALMRRRLRSLRYQEELQIAKDRAEAANRAKSHFLAAASHDLRQPTQALGLFIATLRAMAKKPQLRGEEVGHIASRLQLAMEGLGRLLNGLLDVSRLEAGAVEVTLAPMPVQDVLTQVQNAFAGPAQAKGLKLRVVPSRLWVESDPVVLARIVSNLVANAVRYTERGKVLVGCRRRGDRVEIQVMDTGIGIAEEQRGRIFEEFYQVEEGARDGEQGLGVGAGDRAGVGWLAAWPGRCGLDAWKGVVLLRRGAAGGFSRDGEGGRGVCKARGAVATDPGRRRRPGNPRCDAAPAGGVGPCRTDRGHARRIRRACSPAGQPTLISCSATIAFPTAALRASRRWMQCGERSGETSRRRSSPATRRRRRCAGFRRRDCGCCISLWTRISYANW